MRDKPGIKVKCTDLILFEGIFALYDPYLRELMDLKVFVDTDADVRLLRRIIRDTVERGREIDGVLKSYNRFVRSSYNEFIKPTMKFSDLIVPHGAQNKIAISFISDNLSNKLVERGLMNKANKAIKGKELVECTCHCTACKYNGQEEKIQLNGNDSEHKTDETLEEKKV